jgi:hypothetical protein
MQITIDLPDNLPLTEADVRIELAGDLTFISNTASVSIEPLNSL